MSNFLKRIFGNALLVFCAASCVTIEDGVVCSVAGKLSNGAICSHLLTDKTHDLSFEQTVDFLEANESHGAALCMSSSDWGKMKVALMAACRELGSKCKYQGKK